MKSATNTTFATAGAELRAMLAHGVRRLQEAEVPSAALAAELLLMHVVDRDRAWLYAHPEYEVAADQIAAYVDLIQRRVGGVPTQYLTGHQEFWGVEFEVGPGVLIPRPETEHLVEVALEGFGGNRAQAVCIADIGTGSGCIAIALARELPHARIIATDVSAAALEYARRNAAHHGVADQIEFIETNLLDAFRNAGRSVQADFDLIVSNPPYVGRLGAATLAREVREHEPAEALFAGDKGFDIYAPLVDAAERTLTTGGILVVEIGCNGADYVGSLLSGPHWCDLRIKRDLAGIERVISARLAPHEESRIQVR